MTFAGAGERSRATGVGGRREGVDRDWSAMAPEVETDHGGAAVAQGGQRVGFRTRPTGPGRTPPTPLGTPLGQRGWRQGHWHRTPKRPPTPEHGHRLLYRCSQFHCDRSASAQHRVEPVHPQAEQETHKIADHARNPRTSVHHSTALPIAPIVNSANLCGHSTSWAQPSGAAGAGRQLPSWRGPRRTKGSTGVNDAPPEGGSHDSGATAVRPLRTGVEAHDAPAAADQGLLADTGGRHCPPSQDFGSAPERAFRRRSISDTK